MIIIIICVHIDASPSKHSQKLQQKKTVSKSVPKVTWLMRSQPRWVFHIL